jgi:hypothetical protein
MKMDEDSNFLHILTFNKKHGKTKKIPFLMKLAKNTQLKSNSEKIVYVLSNYWPLTAIQLHNILKKTFDYSQTYQSTYKQLKKMSEEEIILRSNGKCKLNHVWFEEQKKAFQKIINNLK